MKSICAKRKWTCDKDTVGPLLKACEDNGLFPSYLACSVSHLAGVLQSVGTMRNKLSAHGQGVNPVVITEETAAFVLHSTAANILYLASLEKQLK